MNIDILDLPVVVQALMLASFLFGLLLGCALAAGSIAFYMMQPRTKKPDTECLGLSRLLKP